MKFSLDLSAFPIDAEFLTRHAAELQEAMTQELLKTRARIIASDTAGQQAEGGGLKPYSSSYKHAIDAGTVAGKAPGNHTPNLTATGELHRSLKLEPGQTPDEVRMFFEGTHPPRHKIAKPGARVKAANKKRAARGEAAIVAHKHVASSAQKAARSASGKASRKQAKFNAAVGLKKGGALSAPKRSGGGGELSNAAIAQAQYDMGRTGWFTFSTKDIERIQKRIADVISKLLFK